MSVLYVHGIMQQHVSWFI